MDTALQEENRALRQALSEREVRIALLEQKLAHAADLEREIADLEQQIEELRSALRHAASDRALLEAELKKLLARRRSLGDALAAGQLSLFPEPTPPTPPCAKEAPDGETQEDTIRKRHTPRREPREIDYAALPREHVEHEIPEPDRICPVTGKKLVVIGEKTNEELEFRRAQLVVVVHHLPIYGLAEEDRSERQAEPIVTPLPPRPIENALAGPGLLARILVAKYCEHLPLYRQQAIFGREGLDLPRQTLCDWALGSAWQLAPIQEAQKRLILANGVTQLDDTPVQCQAGKGKANFQAYLWTYTSPGVDGVVFDFTPDRGHEHVEAFLGPGLEGYLVGDGCTVHGAVVRKYPGLMEAGCWAHVFRKFRDAKKESPVEALWMMHLIGQLFKVEEEAQTLAPEGVRALRLEKSHPVLGKIQEQLEALKGKGSEGGLLAKALTYLENQWPKLVRFLEDGRVPIHNNACENAIRPVAVGRKNWLFAGSQRGGDAAATIYSLIASCLRVGVDPFLYLRDVLVRVATHPASRVHELVPAQWKVLFASQAAR